MLELEELVRFRAEVPPPVPAVREAALRAMLAGGRRHSRWRMRWTGVLRFAGALALAGAVAVTGLLLDISGSSNGGPVVSTAMDRALAAAAQHALVQAPFLIPPGAYAYQRASMMYLTLAPNNPSIKLVPDSTERRTWTAADGSGLLSETCSFRPCAAWGRRNTLWRVKRTRATSFIILPPVRVMRHFPRATVDLARVDGLSVNELNQLAGQPREILRRIRAVSGSGPASHLRAFLVVGDLLLEPTAPPTLRSSLFEALALFKPVGVTNPHVFEGQWGIAIRVSEGMVTLQLDFNAKTTRLLGFAEWLEKLSVPGQPTFFDEEVESATYGPIQIVRAIPSAKRFPG